jgi:hypothetical protein
MVARHIPAFKLVPQPLSEAAQALLDRPTYVDPSIGERHRLGGSPDRWSDAEPPKCPACRDDMTFYAQLDALPSGGFDLADAGLILVFVCFDCFEVSASLDGA